MNSVDRFNYYLKKINQQFITNHYDEITLNQHSYKVEKSMTTNVRRINNFIKACILMNYVKTRDVVLDLGCGKGGDLQKYQSFKIKKYVGVDVSEESIKEATSRAKNLKLNFITNFFIQDSYNEVLFCGSHKLHQFDVITSQFSFHYAFFDDSSLETAVANISANLKHKGFFIITVPRKNIITNKILKHKAQNSLYSITDVRPKSNKTESWKSYNFSLVGSVNECVEYFVDFLKLTQMLEKENILLVQRTPFPSLLKDYTIKHSDLFRQMKIEHQNADEKDVIGLYEVIVFQKD